MWNGGRDYLILVHRRNTWSCSRPPNKRFCPSTSAAVTGRPSSAAARTGHIIARAAVPMMDFFAVTMPPPSSPTHLERERTPQMPMRRALVRFKARPKDLQASVVSQ